MIQLISSKTWWWKRNSYFMEWCVEDICQIFVHRSKTKIVFVRIKDYKNNHKLINVLVFLLHVLVNNMCECLCVALYIPQSIFAQSMWLSIVGKRLMVIKLKIWDMFLELLIMIWLITNFIYNIILTCNPKSTIKYWMRVS